MTKKKNDGSVTVLGGMLGMYNIEDNLIYIST